MVDISYYTSEALTLLHSLIGIPSISREEEAAADFLQNYIEENGIMTGRSGNNIWCISPMFDINKPTILLNSHIDTVKPVNGWRKHPFTSKTENGKIYGLGSNDAGGSVVSLLQVYRHLSSTEQSYFPCLMRRRGIRKERNRKRPAAASSHYLRYCRRTDRDASGYRRKRTDGY